MKIISFNVNGIRSAINKGLIEWLDKESPDIFCVQEIKAQREQIDILSFQSLGYNYQLVHSARRKGYSGVAIFSKTCPNTYSFGMNKYSFDNEGRVIRADFNNLTIICVYVPSGTTGKVRQAIKMEFLDTFTTYLLNLQRERPYLLVCGDYNICRQDRDINYPERHMGVSGFLPEERAWFDYFIRCGFVDSFREFNQDKNQYSWWSYRSNARAKNLGWRIDYHIITRNLQSQLKSASLLQEIEISDHCPIVVEF
ncbi:MAG: exodeoxyribonuclease III [Candidatus Azobacteroides pseudotrichonymphae]|jgi:exodeoxyribonuclease-3|uniref:Exodeoxyribonuclease III n=1 Tax=Azobacteroides pseudotrichonymphae genomovar. CFP2 TaxID=511995 RepID=B6YQA0_AZOPC|nr:exodeoxyribonuclease III [Candidatus Azobacteroides pseudotrichonymphae]MDR0530167.1 exodeoxyribonuclease III [Bacteroidales bacterium OttesenSCG-928-I14]BAG83372.1 exodeoxyribonuclease III [Candidatus Azobacteroides pseudotrichonymphae genomovar. CFP2]GMO36722.1 MAG: exodeoxyribonuclease III [Candidatus Azobacteroides pseudotrichonymphae]